jgi:hypothetical protein
MIIYASVALVFLLTLSIALQESAIANASTTIFSDDFNEVAVDNSKWIAQQNTYTSPYQGYGGSITINDSYIYLTSEGSSFPQVTSRTNPFPASGDFTLNFDLTYTKIAGWGDGFWVSQGPFEIKQNGDIVNILQVWSWNLKGVQINFLNHTVYQTDLGYLGNVENLNPPTLHIKMQFREPGVYTLYLNNEQIATNQSNLRADTIGFGHPVADYVPFDHPSAWSSFKIGLIEVLSPAGGSMFTSPSFTATPTSSNDGSIKGIDVIPIEILPLTIIFTVTLLATTFLVMSRRKRRANQTQVIPSDIKTKSYCNNCGAENASDAEFCGRCGARLHEDETRIY